MHSDRPTISLCMIVKNEERFLEQCLESVKDLVDEMVIVDTGSTDKTVEIAKKYTDKVLFHEWRNSFSEARNFSLKFVTCDWVLQLDADEKLEKNDIPLLQKTILNKDINAVFLPILSELPDGGISKSYFPRLFKNGKAHFDGIVHNQLIFQGNAIHAEIRLHHYGYNLTPEQMARKNERSGKLLEKQIQEDPNNLFVWHNYIRIHRNEKKYQQVVQEAQDVIDRLPYEQEPASYVMIVYDAACAAYELGRFSEAIRFCQIALSNMPDYVDIMVVYGSILLKMKKYESAIHHFETSLEYLEKIKKSPKLVQLKLDLFNSDYLVYRHLGFCYYQLGNKEKSVVNFEKCISLRPDNTEAHNLLGSIYWELKEMEKAEREFEKLVELLPDHVGGWSNLALLAVQKQELNKAREILAMLANRDNIDPAVLALLGKICVQVGAFDTAVIIFEKQLKAEPHKIEILNNIASCYAQTGNFQAALMGYQSVLQFLPDNADAKRGLMDIQNKINSFNTINAGFATVNKN